MQETCRRAAKLTRRVASRQSASVLLRQTIVRSAETGCLPAAATQRRGISAVTPERIGATTLAQYLDTCGASWESIEERIEPVFPVEASEDGRSFSWKVNFSAGRLKRLQNETMVESPPFKLGNDANGRSINGRLQLWPKGDANASQDSCSLWLCTDSRQDLPMKLTFGNVTREGGSSDFCRFDDVVQDDPMEVSVKLETNENSSVSTAHVEQSLQMTGLQLAEWRLFNAAEVISNNSVVSSPPFRFHHVLLGDMYLEIHPGKPHQEHCALLFRCRIPMMRLMVNLQIGQGSFSKSFHAVGNRQTDRDINDGDFLTVNLSAPGVFEPDGSLVIRAALEEVVTLPNALRDMIPRLNERASWPKRL